MKVLTTLRKKPYNVTLITFTKETLKGYEYKALVTLHGSFCSITGSKFNQLETSVENLISIK